MTLKKNPYIVLISVVFLCMFIYLNCNDFDSTKDYIYKVETFANTFYYCLSTFNL